MATGTGLSAQMTRAEGGVCVGGKCSRAHRKQRIENRYTRTRQHVRTPTGRTEATQTEIGASTTVTPPQTTTDRAVSHTRRAQTQTQTHTHKRKRERETTRPSARPPTTPPTKRPAQASERERERERGERLNLLIPSWIELINLNSSMRTPSPLTSLERRTQHAFNHLFLPLYLISIDQVDRSTRSFHVLSNT